MQPDPVCSSSWSCWSRPSPPAPEGWDKDVSTTTHHSASHYQVSQHSLPSGVGWLCGTRPRPSPPAPEGWDKDLTSITTRNTNHHLHTNHPRSHPSHHPLVQHNLFTFAVISVTNHAHSLATRCAVLSPPAPEGWDKDITQHQHHSDHTTPSLQSSRYHHPSNLTRLYTSSRVS